jgi:hypothetical protein
MVTSLTITMRLPGAANLFLRRNFSADAMFSSAFLPKSMQTGKIPQYSAS